MDKFMTSNTSRGFTLIEILIVVVIVAIVTAMALPAYQDYVIRSRIMPAIQGLSERQTRMEQCYQDHQKDGYEAAGCTNIGSGEISDFVFSFDEDEPPTKDTFKLKATGKAPTMAGFEYTVNQANTRTSKIDRPGKGVNDPWKAGKDSCWITGKSGSPCQ
jgi:type IV pilus assembly protein PilE